MRCERIQEHLSGYLDGSLGWVARRRVAAHLKGCAACRHELRALQRTVALLREAGDERVPRDVAAAVMARVALLPVPARRVPLARPLVWVPAGLAAAAALTLQLSGHPPEKRAQRPSQVNVYVQEYAHFRASQEIGGTAGVFLLASEFSPDTSN